MPPNALIKPVSAVQPLKPKPVVGPQNVGLPTYRPGDVNNPSGALQGVLPAAAPAAAAPAAAPRPDFNALTLTDPQYTTGKNLLDTQNQISLEQMLKGYRGTAQGYQDNANAHGALFSGAAVNAQRSAAQGYADQQRQQALNVGQGQYNLYQNVYNRLLTQLAGGA